MEINKFELETISDRENGVLKVRDFEKNYELVANALAVYQNFDIRTDEEKKDYKAKRAELNKIVKAIDRKRIDTVADYCTEFEYQCNTIKDLFDCAQRVIGEKVKAYEDSQKVALENGKGTIKYTATLKFTDEKIIKKLQDFAVKNGCELTIK